MRRAIYANGRAATLGGVALVMIIVVGGGMAYKNYQASQIDPAVYTPLLNAIAKGESSGNYNAYFGHADNVTIQFTDMSVGDVLKWQETYVRQGSPSSAVGKYQIVHPTLVSLVHKLKIDPGAKFDPALQDRMAVTLLEKRGAKEYMTDRISREEFAANLAKEWAALPRVTGKSPDQSYYAGDGLNKVQISTAEIFRALESIKQ